MEKAYSVRVQMGVVSLQLCVEVPVLCEYPQDYAAELATEWAEANLAGFKDQGGYSITEGEAP